MPPLPERLHPEWLPDGRVALCVEGCLPVVASPAFSDSLSVRDRRRLVWRLSVFALAWCVEHRVPMPWERGSFAEDGEDFVFDYGYKLGSLSPLRVSKRKARP